MTFSAKHNNFSLLEKDATSIQFPKGFSLREATDDDAPAIRALFILTQKEYGFDYDFNGRESDLMEISKVYGQSGAFFGILWDDNEDTLAGIAALKKPDTAKDGCTLEADANTVELCRIYLYPEYRSQGLGRKLVRKMIALARTLGYRTMVLESHTVLIEALRLYKRLGFKEIPPYTPEDPDYSDYAAILQLA